MSAQRIEAPNLPEGRVRVQSPGVITPSDERGPLSGQLVVEVDGKPICVLPFTRMGWGYDAEFCAPKMTVTMLAGASEVTSREPK